MDYVYDLSRYMLIFFILSAPVYAAYYRNYDKQYPYDGKNTE